MNHRTPQESTEYSPATKYCENLPQGTEGFFSYGMRTMRAEARKVICSGAWHHAVGGYLSVSEILLKRSELAQVHFHAKLAELFCIDR